jgi:molecular chaperone GrpE
MENENATMRKGDISLDEFLLELEKKDFYVNDLDGIVEIETYELDSSSFEGLSRASKPASEAVLSSCGIEAVNERVRQLEKERDEMVDFLNRQRSDFENYKRRVERDRLNVMESVMTDFAKKLFPIVDNLDRAIDTYKKSQSEKSEEFKHFLEGIVLVTQQLYELLAEMGVEPIPSVGEFFNPHLHEAVVVERNENVPHNTIVAELLRGYKMGQKVIRHALVKVAVNDSRKQGAEAMQA